MDSNFFSQTLKVARSNEFAIMPKRGTKLSAGVDFFVPKCQTEVTDYHEADRLVMQFLSQAVNCVNQEKLIELWNRTVSQNKDTIYIWNNIINTFILLTCINESMEYNELMNAKLDIQLNGYLSLEPLHDISIPLGVKVDMLPNTMFTAFNKSGVAGKKKLITGACVVDVDYRGQIHLNLHNVGHNSIEIKTGDKLGQFVVVPIIMGDVVEMDINEYEKVETERGAGAFGSTGV